MEKDESKIDMDALDSITDRVLSYRPPKSKAKRPASDVNPSAPDKGPKRRRKKTSSKKDEQGPDDEES